MGVRIANSRGVPGTLGCFARTAHEGRAVILTSWHVLFGAGARGSEVVWRAAEPEGVRRYAPLGNALYGTCGTVRYGGNEYYIDCAVASCAGASAARLLTAVARCGERVTKIGAATGATAGIVLDTAYCGSVESGGRVHPAPRQLLIRSTDPRVPFSAEGDSGALIVNSSNAAVGLLWGTSAEGDSVACHMAPVLQALHIGLSAGHT